MQRRRQLLQRCAAAAVRRSAGLFQRLRPAIHLLRAYHAGRALERMDQALQRGQVAVGQRLLEPRRGIPVRLAETAQQLQVQRTVAHQPFQSLLDEQDVTVAGRSGEAGVAGRAHGRAK